MYSIVVNYTFNGFFYTCTFNVFVRCLCDAGFLTKLKYEPCTGIYVDFSSDCQENNYYHVWDFGDGCSIEGYGEDMVSNTDPQCHTSGTYANPTHAYNMNTYNNTNTTVTAMHTLTPGVSPATQSQTLVLENIPALPAGDGIYIGNTDYTNDLSDMIASGVAPASPVNTRNFYIFGTLNMNVNYQIDDSNIFMSQGAAIIASATAPAVLTIQDQTLVAANPGCNCMWRWIQAASGSRLRILDRVVIRDALFGVYPLGNSTAVVKQSIFRNNFVGLFADHGDFILSQFRSNTFETSTGTTLIPSCGLAEAELEGRDIFSYPDIFMDQSTGFAGILTKDLAAFDIPVLGTPNNTHINVFINLANGIVLRNTSAELRYCRFESIGGSSYAENGVGISLKGDTPGLVLDQEGIMNITGTPLTFDNCNIGIWVETNGAGTQILSRNNDMDNIQLSGYLMSANDLGSFVESEIFDNLITALINGIYVNISDAVATSEFQIHDNTITCTQSPVWADISLWGNDMTQHQAQIYGNEINAINTKLGIWLLDWQQDPSNIFPTIADNTINLSPVAGDFSEGINSFNSDNIDIRCNHIWGSYIPNPPANTYGISNYFSLNSKTLQNDLHDLNHGIEVTGDCTSPNSIGKNIFMDDMDIGLYYGAGAITGDQLNMGNDWSSGSFNSYGAVHNGDDASIALSRYYMPTSGFPTIDLPFAINEVWFYTGGNNYSEYCQVEGLMAPPEFSENDELIASQSSEDGAFSEEQLRQLKASLYRRIRDSEGLSDLDNPFLIEYASSLNDLPIRQLYDMEESIGNLNSEMIAPYADEINEIYTHINEIRESIHYIDSLISEDIEGLEMERNGLAENLDNKYVALQAIYDAVREQMVGGIEGLLNQNTQISPECNIDELEKQLNRIYLAGLFNNESLSDDDISIIESIAYTCPEIGGKRVYYARSLYYQLTGVMAESDCELEQRGNYKNGSNIKNDFSFNIYPNPAGDMLFVDYEVPQKGEMSLEIRDMLGRIVVKLPLPTSFAIKFPMSTASLSEGLYTLSLRSEDRVLKTIKLSIFH
jgi:hypothetical protein